MKKVVQRIELAQTAVSLTSIVCERKYRKGRVELVVGEDFDLSECGNYALIYESAHDKLKEDLANDQN